MNAAASDGLLRLAEQLAHYQSHADSEAIRTRVRLLLEMRSTIDYIAQREVSDGMRDANSGKARLHRYLHEHRGQILSAEELSVVAGISEYGRRLRELRADGTLRVLCGPSPDPRTGRPLRPDEYLCL